MKKPSRRTVLGTLGAAGLGLVGARLATPWFLRARPLRPIGDLSPAAQDMVRRAFADVDRAQVWDVHTHLVGLASGGNGCWVNPVMRSHLHPVSRVQFDIYLAASGVTDAKAADQQFLERLLAQHRAANPAGKLMLLAFDYRVNEDGEEVREESAFHTPNEYVLRVARENDDVLAIASVHPYRRDAVARLEEVAAGGARAIKWLPNSMGIDPAHPRCRPYYERMAALGLRLLTHVGLERAVVSAHDQENGNPLRLRPALDAGVIVLAAHCASQGESLDLDAPATPELESFDLFLRLMGEKQYEGRLFGEISTLTQVNRSGRPLREMLAARELHPRLVNGSDYPLPAIDPLYSTRQLVQRGYIDADQRRLLNEIYGANPLLFDYVLKREVSVQGQGAVHRFAPLVFESARVFA
jgi:mannonate dehydratase